jgi:hypothetical protein
MEAIIISIENVIKSTFTSSNDNNLEAAKARMIRFKS